MAISQWPPAQGAEANNNFVLDKNNSTNNYFVLPREFAAGGYSIELSSGDTSYDIYLLNAAGSTVGYSNSALIVASESFVSASVLGVGTAEVLTFNYAGPVADGTAFGTAIGAGAYLTSITPSDLPNINDTATVIGGNFANNVEINFVSGTASLSAKNVVRTDSTALVVTRPDDLIQDNSPYTLVAINPGVPEPSGSNLNRLVGTVTAGSDPTFVSDPLILGANPGTAFTFQIQTADSDGTVVNWQVTAGTVPPGLSLATATGIIGGTPTTAGDYYFTVRITDDGNNTNTREFNLPVGPIFSGGSVVVSGGTTYRTFTSSSSFIAKNSTNKSIEYILIAGGGGGGGGEFGNGGGGAGGLLAGTTLVSTGTSTVTIGAGAAQNSSGSNSVWVGFATATGGGRGAQFNASAEGGGSGGGAAGETFGTGIAGQGFRGGTTGSQQWASGGGGAGAVGVNGTNTKAGDGGAGGLYGAWASAISIIYNAGYFAGGGGGGIGLSNTLGTAGAGGIGGGGRGANVTTAGNISATNGSANSGGGGGGGASASGRGITSGEAGGSGLLVVRYT